MVDCLCVRLISCLCSFTSDLIDAFEIINKEQHLIIWAEFELQFEILIDFNTSLSLEFKLWIQVAIFDLIWATIKLVYLGQMVEFLVIHLYLLMPLVNLTFKSSLLCSSLLSILGLWYLSFQILLNLHCSKNHRRWSEDLVSFINSMNSALPPDPLENILIRTILFLKPCFHWVST